MADKKLTDASITLLAHPAKGDYLYIVSDPAGSPLGKKIYTENAMESLNLGWLWVAASGTYVSTSSFRVSGDYTAYFKIGTKIKLSNTTTKYFYVASSSYSAPYTTVTVVANTTHTLANTTLTNIYLSYANPPDFPYWLDCVAPVWDTTTIDNGAGGQPGTFSTRFCINGSLMTLKCQIALTGVYKVGAGIRVSFTLPVGLPANQDMSYTCLGVANMGTPDYTGIVLSRGSGTAMAVQSSTSIADNADISGLSFVATIRI